MIHRSVDQIRAALQVAYNEAIDARAARLRTLPVDSRDVSVTTDELQAMCHGMLKRVNLSPEEKRGVLLAYYRARGWSDEDVARHLRAGLNVAPNALVDEAWKALTALVIATIQMTAFIDGAQFERRLRAAEARAAAASDTSMLADLKALGDSLGPNPHKH